MKVTIRPLTSGDRFMNWVLILALTIASSGAAAQIVDHARDGDWSTVAWLLVFIAECALFTWAAWAILRKDRRRRASVERG